MELVIDNIHFNIDYDSTFSESLSVLRKDKKISLSLSFYLESNVGTTSKKLNILKKMKSIPDTILITKGGRYFWVFEGCNLISLSFKKDEKYHVEMEKCDVKLEIGYDGVFGTSKPEVVKREIALNNLFGRD